MLDEDIYSSKIINNLITKYYNFIKSCTSNEIDYKLTQNDQNSAYARCFAIFGLNLIGKTKELNQKKEYLNNKIIDDLFKIKKDREKVSSDLLYDKPYLQLLCFSLSALSILNKVNNSELEIFIIPLIKRYETKILKNIGVFDCKPQSGNFAMFYAILLYHAEKYFDAKNKYKLSEWFEIHLKNINKNGFWGNYKNINYLQFQNGFHQYEIFNFFNINNSYKNKASEQVYSLIDSDGLFAPYPGGGGCFDYDATSIISSYDNSDYEKFKPGLLNTLNYIINSQNHDGGFSESIYVRPFQYNYFLKTINKFLNYKNNLARLESLKYSVNLLRSKHSKIYTHWSKNPRNWNESNLWDSWFRVLTIVIILEKFKLRKDLKFNYINYPGIGFRKILS